MNTKKGFTLVELLVVVAVIGVLSTIVLVALGAAREKAKDTKIKALMSQMRIQGELFNIEHGSYRGTDSNGWANDDIAQCTNGLGNPGGIFDINTDLNITSLIREVHDISSSVNVRVFCRVSNDTQYDSWAFSAPLYDPEDGTTGWCIDSSGSSKAVNFIYDQAGFSYNLWNNNRVSCP